MKNEYERSRYHQRSKKRKTNIILNSLIIIVLLLIIIVSVNIFFNNDDKTSGQEENQVEEKESDNGATKDEEDSTKELEEESEKENQDVTDESESEENDQETEVSSENEGNTDSEVIEESSDDPNIIKTIVNPAWKPVGTVQTGEHANVYDGVDWDEMVKAITYATGLQEENMTIFFLGNNGHNKSVGTVYSKSNKEEIYRVYIEWVDEQGWKPTKVEELASIPEKPERE